MAKRGWGFLVLFTAWTVPAYSSPPNIQIDQVSAGANGDSRVQYIQLRMQSADDRFWGPQIGEQEGRLKLVFRDATGAQVGSYLFTSDAPVGVLDPIRNDYSILLATAQFASTSGMPAPDFILPIGVMPQDGQICVTHNGANPNADAINLCLSYGNFVSDTGQDTLGQSAGSPASALPITNASALVRTGGLTNYGVGQFNADFGPGTPAPRNSAGNTGSFSVGTAIEQGRNLFLHETFSGNGRTCSTCHLPEIKFGLDSTAIGFLKPTDPLFVAENIPGLAALENSCLLRGSRGLNLENIDGFENPPVFRGSPNLINLAFTAPYGRSGEFATLQQFATGAVKQHFPKSLSRNADPALGPLDFRLPTATELTDLEAFMNSIKLPANGNFTLSTMTNAAINRGGDAAAISRGQSLFFGNTGSAKCFLCHSGPVLAASMPILGGGNRAFDTGVSDLPINATFADACVGGQPLPGEAGGNRTFSTPALLGVGTTAPYFHNNAVRTLREAVAFYTGPEFNNSPAAMDPHIGTINLSSQDIDDLTAFLNALEEPFIDCNSDTQDDRLQIADGAADCNANGVLDACELAGNDCDGNGVLDACDLVPAKLSAPETHTTNYGGFFISAADVDGDGHTDLLLPGWTAKNLVVMLNDGNGTTFTDAGSFNSLSFPRALAAADFDGDGDVDVALPNLLVGSISIFLNNGNDINGAWQGFTKTASIPMNGSGVTGGTIHVLAADFNGDGRPDLAACKNFAGQVAIVLNLGPDGGGAWQGFGSAVDYNSGGSSPWSMAAGRINADNALDIVVANRGTDTIGVLLNNGDGTFASVTNYAVQDSPEAVAIADLDGDSAQDVIVANSDSDTLSVFMGTGAGSLATPTTQIVGSYPFGAQPHSVAVLDIDQDGRPDLVTANKVSKNISILLNKGGGQFSAPVNTPVDVGPDYAVVADMNGDGKPDILAAQFSAATCAVFFNQTQPFGGDCNRNGIPDSCDVASGVATDFNGNGLLDSCEHWGDLNADLAIDETDLAIFVAVLLGDDTDPVHMTRADMTANGSADGLDIRPFVTRWIGP